MGGCWQEGQPAPGQARNQGTHATQSPPQPNQSAGPTRKEKETTRASQPDQQQKTAEPGGGGPGGGDGGIRGHCGNDSHSLKILYTNAQSVQNKVNELCGVASDLEPDIILLTETWCNTNISNSQLKVPGYDMITELRQDRVDTQQGIGGGLLVYI